MNSILKSYVTSMWAYIHSYTGYCVRSLELKLQTLWAAVRLLGFEPGSSGRAAGALHFWAISSASIFYK